MPIDLTKHTFTSPRFQSVLQEAIDFFTRSPIRSLPPEEGFIGAGVYALYYCGDFEHYRPISTTDRSQLGTPIYLGKAVPPGWRIGRTGSTGTNSRPLYSRLREHSRNIDLVENLKANDFCCRFMILGETESDLISACEAQLIRRFVPLWNTVVDGFGNHTPGKGRFDQARSEWDVLHVGRSWATLCRGTAPSVENIITKITRHF